MKLTGYLLCGFLLVLAGCNTITPQPLELPKSPSWDISSDGDAEANGGVLVLTASGAQITQRALRRYDALIALYGSHFVPSLQARHGVQVRDDEIFLSNDGLEKFALMNQWRRIGKTP